MKIGIILLLASSSLFAQNLSDLKDVITDPAVSRRCKALITDRDEKVRFQQKLNFLLLRNQKIRKKTKVTQTTLRNRLDLNQIQIKNNLRLSQMRLKSMEENIVRKGCPGITL